MDQGTIAYWPTWVGTGAWVVCFWWMHRISTQQDALLTELRELARGSAIQVMLARAYLPRNT
jgi:hypothetical protein